MPQNASGAARIGVNPLPWVLRGTEFTLDVPTLRAAFAEVATTGFTAVQSDIPAGLNPPEYSALLSEFGLRPGPGYFSADFTSDPADVVERAHRHAAAQVELGLSTVFLASDLTPSRIAAPAVGTDHDAGRLATIVENVAIIAGAIRAEGALPCLHPHVGSWIETEQETRAVLDQVDAGLLAFGPDTGHLYWAGMDPAAIISEYAERIGGVHLKDVYAAARESARAKGSDYFGATNDQSLWTEPGRGDVDLNAALEAVPAGFTGWFVVEVDVPDGVTPLVSTERSAQWVASQARLAALESV